MYKFRTSADAAFRCDVDFAHNVAINVFFHDETLEVIPFHISLRRDERLIVVNRYDQVGWRREIAFEQSFAKLPMTLEVRFSGQKAEVWIDGALLAQFDSLPRFDLGGRFLLRRGFPSLSEIAYVVVEGHLVAGSLSIDSPAAFEAGIGLPALNDAIEVVLEGMTPSAADQGNDGELQIEGFSEPIAAFVRTTPYVLPGSEGKDCVRVWAAVVPGRVWANCADALEMTLVSANGTKLGSLSVTRKELASKIGELVSSGTLDRDDRAALQAIEHVRHARLLSFLSAKQSDLLLGISSRFMLKSFMLEGQSSALEETWQPPLLEGDPEAERVERSTNKFVVALNKSPDLNPVELMDSLLRAEKSLTARQVMIERVVEWFCLNGRMWDLVELWQKHTRTKLVDYTTTNWWHVTSMLPLYYARGNFDDVAKAIKMIAWPTNDWILVPCIGWIIAQTGETVPSAKGRVPTEGERRAIGSAVARWLLRWSREYWGRTECVTVIRGMVTALAASGSLNARDRDLMVKLALRVYGLSPSLWEAVEAAQSRSGWQAPQPILDAQVAFNELNSLLNSGGFKTDEGRARIDDLLGQFQQWRTVDVTRFRRDILGPAGISIPSGSMPSLSKCDAAGMDPDEAALRFMGYPHHTNREAPPPAELTQAARRCLRKADVAVEHGRKSELQEETLPRALTLIEGRDQEALDRLIEDLPKLSAVHNRFLGIGLGLSIITALLTQGRDTEAAQLVPAVFAGVDSIDHPLSLAYLPRTPAPRLAMAELIRTHPDHALTQKLTDVLEPLGVCAPLPPLMDSTDDLAQSMHPLLNTVVCLYTCRPNLNTRVKIIRDGWLKLLADMGVPCLVFVGGGSGEREGDVVYLDAPDDYEGLPQKTLAMARWVYENTRYSYLVKIDDDCFMNPQEYLGDLAYLKFDYYGRRLTRNRWNLDRTWHMGKSQSERGRLELDKSPEPSSYADGGSSYTLSRVAMAALVETSQTAEGKELIQLSFMEDKLVGDLLGLRHIWPENEDYHIAVLRHTNQDGPLVPMWHNNFLPFAGIGIKLAHLDGHERQVDVLEGSQKPWPQDFKVWPSYQPVRLGWGTNTLSLISTPEKLARVNEAEVAVVATLRNEAFMLDAFLDHYRKLGVKGFLIADNGSDDGTFERLAEEPDVALFAVETLYNLSQYGVAWQQALLANFRTGRWSLAADADELLFWNSDLSGDLPELVKSFDKEGATAARVFMLDMYPKGPMSEATFVDAGPFEQAAYVDREPFQALTGWRGVFSASPVWTGALRHRLLPESRAELFVAQKIALLKYMPWMRLTAGLHFVGNTKVSQHELIFAHFKYNASFRAKAQTEVERKQHFNDAEEYRKYLSLAAEGRDLVYDPDVSVRWDECNFVLERCDKP